MRLEEPLARKPMSLPKSVSKSSERLTTEQIVALRPPIARPEPSSLPLDVVDEWEPSGLGTPPARVRTIFLRGSECRFHCVMCDLWRFTLAAPAAPGAIAQQVRHALSVPGQTPGGPTPPTWIKLYNASSFFDAKNVPEPELPLIAQHLQRYQRVIIENHPRLLPWPIVDTFRQQLSGRLEIAMGLETVEPSVLRRLNKQMTVDDFAEAARACRARDVDVRAFVLLRPPWLDERSALDWCRRSIEFAIQHAARHVSVIPTRGGNGALEWLRSRGEFEPPQAASLEQILDAYRLQPECVVTVDLWDWDRLRGTCPRCTHARRARLERINVQRCAEPPIECEDCHAGLP